MLEHRCGRRWSATSFKSERRPTTTWPVQVVLSPPAWKRPGTAQSPRNAISLRPWPSARQEVRTRGTCSLLSLPHQLLLTMVEQVAAGVVAWAVANAKAGAGAEVVARAAKTVARVLASLAVQLRHQTADPSVSATTTRRSTALRPDALSSIAVANVSAATPCLGALAMLRGQPQRLRAVALGCEGGQGRQLLLPLAPRSFRSQQPLHLTLRFFLRCHLPLQVQHQGSTVRFTSLQAQSENRI